MKAVKIEANAKPNKNNELKAERHIELDFEMPETVAEAVSAFGETVCLTKITQAVTIDVQGAARRQMEKGKTNDQVVQFFGNVNYENPEAEAKPWAPGIAPARKSKVEKLLAGTEDMSDEEWAAFLKNVKERRAGKKEA